MERTGGTHLVRSSHDARVSLTITPAALLSISLSGGRLTRETKLEVGCAVVISNPLFLLGGVDTANEYIGGALRGRPEASYVCLQLLR